MTTTQTRPTYTPQPEYLEHRAADTRAGEHWVAPQTKGWGRIGRVGALLIFAGVFLILAILWVVPSPKNFIAALIVAAVYFVLFMWSTSRDHHGDSVLDRILPRLAWQQAHRKGHTYYWSGPRSRFGTWRLPGVLAATSCSQQVDAMGREYAMVFTPATGDMAVTIKAHPDGASLLAQADLDNAVDGWEAALRFLCNEQDCVQAQVIIETAADPGYALREKLLGRITGDASPIARAVTTELAEAAGAGASTVDTYVVLTFAGGRTKPPRVWAKAWNWLMRRPPLAQQQGRTERAMAASLSARLPDITTQLAGTGAGPCDLVTPVELASVVRVQYDPECADTIEEARMTGNPWQMRWDSIGPVAANNAPTYYRHCGGVSRTWTATDIQGAVYDQSMRNIMEPSRALTRKRVGMTWTLHNPGESAMLAQADVNTAQWNLNTSHNPSQKLTDTRVAAGVTAIHRGRGGAGVVDVAVTMTCTILDPDRPRRAGESDEDFESRPTLDTMNSVVRSIGPAAQLQFRAEDFVQASAFAGTIVGPGLRISELSNVPAWVRSGL